MHLDKQQLKFLKKLFSEKELKYNSLSVEDKSIADFLLHEKLANGQYQPRPKVSGSEISMINGPLISVKISQSGKAYLSERTRNVWIFIFKDCIIPIIVSFITTVITLITTNWLSLM